MSKGTMKPVSISPVLNGWICRVGCQTVLFTDKQTMLNELGSYIDDPHGTEKRFVERAVNRTMDEPQPRGIARIPEAPTETELRTARYHGTEQTSM